MSGDSDETDKLEVISLTDDDSDQPEVDEGNDESSSAKPIAANDSEGSNQKTTLTQDEDSSENENEELIARDNAAHPADVAEEKTNNKVHPADFAEDETVKLIAGDNKVHPADSQHKTLAKKYDSEYDPDKAAKFIAFGSTCFAIKIVLILLGVAVFISLIVLLSIVIFHHVLIGSLPQTDISDTLRRYERTVNGTTGWDINAMGGYPLMMDAWTPTWINRTVRKSGVLVDHTWRFDNTCSDSMLEELRRRGVSIADGKPRLVPCEKNATKRCARIPFHIHLHGAYTENRYAADGSKFTYRGLFHHDYFGNYLSMVAKNNPLAVAVGKAHVDFSGTPRKLKFPKPPELPSSTQALADMAGTCVDANHLVPQWYQDSKGFDVPEGMKRPLNVMLYSAQGEVTRAISRAQTDDEHIQQILESTREKNAEGPGSSYMRDKWSRRDMREAHVPSESALSMNKCLHINGDHPESRVHSQRCVNADGKEVVLVEEFGPIGHKEWIVLDKKLYAQYCSNVADPSDCGNACGYFVVPLGEELLAYGGIGQMDPESPEARSLEIVAGSLMLDFEGDNLVMYQESQQTFRINEKPSPNGPPAYHSELEVAPVTEGAPVPSSFDPRGEVRGLAVYPYRFAQKGDLMRSMHIMYFNLYKDKTTFGSGCGMPDKKFLWSSDVQCVDSASIKSSFTTLREISMNLKTDALGRAPKVTDSFVASYAFITTLRCSGEFLRSYREDSHGIDWMEHIIWLHQLSEYSLDVDLDGLVRRRYWNYRQRVNDTCSV